MMFNILWIAIFGTAITSHAYTLDKYNHDRVYLAETQSLLFQRGQKTTAKRNYPIEQMSCKGGHCQFGPDYVMCKNMGSTEGNPLSGEMTDQDVVWECTGHGLTPGYVLADATVSCEGYENPHDPYVLRGSCGVVYSINKDYSYTEPIVTTKIVTTDFVNQPYHYPTDYVTDPYYHNPTDFVTDSYYRNPTDFVTDSYYRNPTDFVTDPYYRHHTGFVPSQPYTTYKYYTGDYHHVQWVNEFVALIIFMMFLGTIICIGCSY